MYQQEQRNVYRKWFLIFLFGFLIGIFIMNFFSSQFIEDHEILSVTVMNRMRYLEVDGGSFLRYELPKRMKLFLILLFVSTTCFGIIAAYVLIAWHGLLTGMMITAAMIRFGLKGVLFILAGLFPQQLLFIPAAVMMLCWCCQTCCFLYFPEKSVWPFYQNKRRQYIHQAGMLLWIFCVVIIGCILECYVNPILMSDVVKIF